MNSALRFTERRIALRPLPVELRRINSDRVTLVAMVSAVILVSRIGMVAGADEERSSASTSPVAKKAEPTSQIRGTVIDEVTGLPAVKVEVTIEPTKQSVRTWPLDARQPRSTKTDAEGRYEFDQVVPAEYNVMANATDRTCVALNSIEVTADLPCQADDLKLIEGVLLEGRVQTLKGRPVSHDTAADERLRICVNGPARPKSGKLFHACDVDNEGRFQIRVPPGRTSLFVLQPKTWSHVWRAERFLRGIVVEPGGTAFVNLKVLDKPAKKVPSWRFERDPVKIPLPVESERNAAETIRDLGRWYKLDVENHVIEINMSYDTRTGTRYENPQTNSDEAMWIAPAFPRLTKLFLKKSQATDDSMACLSELSGLETFAVWDGHSLTDASAKHWVHLVNLTDVHVGASRISDETLKELAKLPKLTRVSLQENSFSNEGLAGLESAHQIRRLSIGLGKTKYTDSGLAHLAGLENLEELDMQDNQITDEGLMLMKEMRSLRTLYLRPTKATAEGRAELQKQLPALKIQ